MGVLESYRDNKNAFNGTYDFSLIRVNDSLLVGEDKDGNVSLISISMEQQRDSVAQKTKELSFECNSKITYIENNEKKHDICHVVRCYSKIDRDRNVFLELCDTFFLNKTVNMDMIIEVFSIMNNFFARKKSYSKEMLQGLYAELYSIYFFRNKIDLAKSWQNKDRMKFDFSINEDTKLEVKSTNLQSRIHHFKHEQLATNIVDIYILSYKLREDNDGLSLLELISRVLPLLNEYPKKQARILKLKFDCKDEGILKELKYLEEYTISNMRFFNAKDVPKFSGDTPTNVSDAEYNSNCEGVKFIPEEEIVDMFKEKIEQ